MGYKVKRIMVGTQQVRPDTWKPGSNTVAYRPLTSSSTVNDLSGNSHTLTNSGSVTFGTYKGVDCAYFSGSNYLYNASFYSNQNAITVSGWMYFIANSQYSDNVFRWGSNLGTWVDRINNNQLRCSPGLSAYIAISSDAKWCHYAFTYSGGSTGTLKFYANGVLIGTNSSATPPSSSGIAISRSQNNNEGYFKGGQSNIIVENKVRTDTEVLNYYNLTKSNYGL